MVLFAKGIRYTYPSVTFSLIAFVQQLYCLPSQKLREHRCTETSKAKEVKCIFNVRPACSICVVYPYLIFTNAFSISIPCLHADSGMKWRLSPHNITNCISNLGLWSWMHLKDNKLCLEVFVLWGDLQCSKQYYFLVFKSSISWYLVLNYVHEKL